MPVVLLRLTQIQAKHHDPGSWHGLDLKAESSNQTENGDILRQRFADDSVPRTHGPKFGHGDAAHEMREGPSKPACRSRFQTTLSCMN